MPPKEGCPPNGSSLKVGTKKKGIILSEGAAEVEGPAFALALASGDSLFTVGEPNVSCLYSHPICLRGKLERCLDLTARVILGSLKMITLLVITISLWLGGGIFLLGKTFGSKH
jgi:hypothetical protein